MNRGTLAVPELLEALSDVGPGLVLLVAGVDGYPFLVESEDTRISELSKLCLHQYADMIDEERLLLRSGNVEDILTLEFVCAKNTGFWECCRNAVLRLTLDRENHATAASLASGGDASAIAAAYKNWKARPLEPEDKH